MGKMNVAQFAGELGLPVELLLEQLQSAGVSKQKESDAISEQDKAKLLEHLRSAHGASKGKITVTRRETTAIKKADGTGKSRTIQVEVRKKRTIAPLAAPAEEKPAPEAVVAPTKPKSVLDEQQQKAREEEARLQAELAARQAAEIQAKQERSKRKSVAAEPAPAPAPAPEPVLEAKPAVVAAPAAAPAEATEGTLHKPTLKPGDKVARPVKKIAEKPAAKDSPWDGAGHKKRPPSRTPDTRAGVGVRAGGSLRAGRHDKHSKPEAGQHAFSLPTEPIVQEVMVPETISVAELAQKMSIKAAEIIKTLMKMGSMVTINQVLDQETAMILVEELGHKAARPSPTIPMPS